MATEERGASEEQIRALCSAGKHDAATTKALRVYGDEVFRFLVASVRNEGDGSDAFSLFAEDLWKSMPTFEWGCSLRTWAYTLARRAGARTMRKGWNRKAVLDSAAIRDVVQEVRTQTLLYLRTETKTRLRELRSELEEADQALLMLRVDRGLAWEELARIFIEEADEGPEALKREAARLRKRFQSVKDRLKELAKREGLYRASDDG